MCVCGSVDGGGRGGFQGDRLSSEEGFLQHGSPPLGFQGVGLQSQSIMVSLGLE